VDDAKDPKAPVLTDLYGDAYTPSGFFRVSSFISKDGTYDVGKSGSIAIGRRWEDKCRRASDSNSSGVANIFASKHLLTLALSFWLEAHAKPGSIRRRLRSSPNDEALQRVGSKRSMTGGCK
jgi:hypothetical protein